MSELFRVKLADVVIECSVQYASTRQFCKDFFTEDATDDSVQVSQADIDEEGRLVEQGFLKFGHPVEKLNDSDLEIEALYAKIWPVLLQHDVLYYHGAVIEKGGKAVMFSAPSGTGKTTHIRLWQKVFGEAVTVINGDKPLLKFTKQGIFVYGSPWQGKENYGCNTKAPLAAICALQRGTENRIEKTDILSMLPVLLQQTHHFKRPEEVQKMMELITRFCETELYDLFCNMQPEAAIVAEKGIFHSIE